MKKIGIIANEQKDINFEYTKKIYDWIKERNIQPVLIDRQCRQIECDFSVSNIDQMCEVCKYIIVLGGDGTILRVARESAMHSVPIIGINLGTLGYLTDVDRSEGLHALEKLLAGEFKSEKRMMLEVLIEGEEHRFYTALNDVCILRSSVGKMVTFDLLVNEEYIDTYRADGMIISTPTGSTAYNLSAGGPILKPDIELITMTPICPHKIYSRSSVVSSKDEVNIIINEFAGEDVVLTLDSQVHIPLKAGTKVKIKKSRYYTSIIKTNNLGFYDILRLKFNH